MIPVTDEKGETIGIAEPTRTVKGIEAKITFFNGKEPETRTISYDIFKGTKNVATNPSCEHGITTGRFCEVCAVKEIRNQPITLPYALPTQEVEIAIRVIESFRQKVHPEGLMYISACRILAKFLANYESKQNEQHKP